VQLYRNLIASTRTLPLPLVPSIEKLYELGFSRIDINYANLERSGVDDPSVLTHFRWALLTANKIGINLVTLHAPWEEYFLLALGRGVDYAVAEAKLLMDMAYSYGIEVVVFHPFSAKHVGAHRVEWLNKRFFALLAEHSEREGLSIIAVENAAHSWPWRSLEKLAELVKRIDNPMLKVCLDTGHANLNGYNFSDAARIFAGMSIACMHVHDNNGRVDEHAMPGTGSIDWSKARFLPEEALKRIVVEVDCREEPKICGLHIVAAFAATRELLLGQHNE